MNTGPDLARLLRGEPIEVPAAGSSMLPLIRSGDVVTVVPFGDRAPREGDVVLATIRGHFVLHRIVHIECNGPAATCGTAPDPRLFELRGDFNPTSDPQVRRVELLGLATEARRASGRRVPLDWSSQTEALWMRATPLVRRALKTGARLRAGLRGQIISGRTRPPR